MRFMLATIQAQGPLYAQARPGRLHDAGVREKVRERVRGERG